MINVDFTNIDNARMVGRILPFWARGRKMSLLIQALIYPLKYVHDNFKLWALERYIENHITGQKLSIEWYLKYKLHSHFKTTTDTFFITQHLDELMVHLTTGFWDNTVKWNNYVKWENGKVGQLSDFDEALEGTTIVYAPPIIETISYNYEDYERDIRFIMSKYMINFSKINILISET